MPKKALDFFKKKLPWSKYKDGILDYYLKPYLHKVARLGKPIAIIDCFAGAGRFEDGSDGSPWIISKRLLEAQSRGVEVLGVFIEKHKTLHRILEANMKECGVPNKILFGDFHKHIDYITKISDSHTIFLYLDPIRPKDLAFFDLSSVYDKIGSGSSVETLVNFMSTSVARAAAAAIKGTESNKGAERTIATINEIMGTKAWQGRINDDPSATARNAKQLSSIYRINLKKWFSYTLAFPLKESYSHKSPKYHLIFGSRYPDAIDLMNNGMVRARRDFLGAHFSNDLLFDLTPETEIVNYAILSNQLYDTLRYLGPCSWKELRVRNAIRTPGKYLESDFNSAIKQLIQNERVKSSIDSKRIEPNAILTISK